MDKHTNMAKMFFDESTIPITNRMIEIKIVVPEPIGVKFPKN